MSRPNFVCSICEDFLEDESQSVCATCARVVAKQHPELVKQAIMPSRIDYGTNEATIHSLTAQDYDSMLRELGWSLDVTYGSALKGFVANALPGESEWGPFGVEFWLVDATAHKQLTADVYWPRCWRKTANDFSLLKDFLAMYGCVHPPVAYRRFSNAQHWGIKEIAA